MSPSSLMLLHDVDNLQLSDLFIYFFNKHSSVFPHRQVLCICGNKLTSSFNVSVLSLLCLLLFTASMYGSQIIAACGACCSICCNISRSRQLEFTSHTFPSWDLHSKASHVNKIDVSDTEHPHPHIHSYTHRQRRKTKINGWLLAFIWLLLEYHWLRGSLQATDEIKQRCCPLNEVH